MHHLRLAALGFFLAVATTARYGAAQPVAGPERTIGPETLRQSLGDEPAIAAGTSGYLAAYRAVGNPLR